MSRTYRKFPVFFCDNCDKPSIRNSPHVKGHPDSCECDPLPDYRYDGVSLYRKMVKSSDHKVWYNPPKSFKRDRQQRFRSQVKQALHNHVYKGKDFIPPVNKKTDKWEWL